MKEGVVVVALFGFPNQAFNPDGGKKEGGWGAKPHEEENSFRPPSPRNILPPPPLHSISLSKSLRNAQSFPRMTT